MVAKHKDKYPPKRREVVDNTKSNKTITCSNMRRCKVYYSCCAASVIHITEMDVF
jgi:hypothetical protein